MKAIQAFVSWLVTWFTFPQRLAKLEAQVYNAREFAWQEGSGRIRDAKEMKELIIRESARLFAVTVYFINYEENLFDSAVFYGREHETKNFQIPVQIPIPSGTMVIIAGCGDIERFCIGNELQNVVAFGIAGSRISSFRKTATPGVSLSISIKFGAPATDPSVSQW